MRTLAIFIAMSIMMTIGAYAFEAQDVLDRKASEMLFTYGPSSIMQVQAESDAVRRQKAGAIDWNRSVEDGVDIIQRQLADKFAEKSSAAVKPDLINKKSSGAPISAGGPNTILVEGWTYDVAIGSGAPISAADGRIVGETIGGVRHIYVNCGAYGFGTIEGAMGWAQAGDIVVVGVSASPYEGTVSLKSGVRLYGMRDPSGKAPVFSGVMFTPSFNYYSQNIEIRGFTFSGTSFLYLTNGAFGVGKNIIVRNNTIAGNLHINRMDVLVSENIITGALRTFNAGTVTLKNNIFDTIYRPSEIRNEYTGVQETIRIGAGTAVSAEGNEFRNWSVKMMSASGIKATYFSKNNNYLYGRQYADVHGHSDGDYFGDPDADYDWDTLKDRKDLRYTVDPNRDVKPAIRPKEDTRHVPDHTDGLTDKQKEPIYNTIYELLAKKSGSSGIIADVVKTLLEGVGSSNGAAGGIGAGQLADGVENGTAASAALTAPPAGAKEGLAGTLTLARMSLHPTESEKELLDAARSILSDLEKIREESGSDELKELENEYVRMVAAIFAGRNVPDLLREGDFESMKKLFAETSARKDALVGDYKMMIAPYYVEMKNEIRKIASALKVTGALSEYITDEVILRLSPEEIDKIVCAIEKGKDVSQKEKQLLQKEERSRARYITPNLIELERGMRKLMGECSQALYSILYEKGQQ